MTCSDGCMGSSWWIGPSYILHTLCPIHNQVNTTSAFEEPTHAARAYISEYVSTTDKK
eukprot:m.87822 g.87822  ORF g.87822 m.87822 type:complete len:58 (-) comp13129_c2_seq8:1189-1362(-)